MSATQQPVQPPKEQDSGYRPTLFGEGYAGYEVKPATFLVSFVVHTVGLALIVWSTTWVVANRDAIKQNVVEVFSPTDPSEFPLPLDKQEAGGGGGGGGNDKFEAPKGGLPKSAMEQFTPPMVVQNNPDPKLAMEPTVVVPPQIALPSSSQLGDPFSKQMSGILSSGTGSGSGVGTGIGTGVGPGRGAGVGEGSGGGYGGGNVMRVGGSVSAPKLVYGPDPEFSDEARRAKYQGVVVLSIIVDENGRPRNIRVQRSLGMGLDEKALEAVRNWRFEPAKKDGHPVAVLVSIEVDFNLR